MPSESKRFNRARISVGAVTATVCLAPFASCPATLGAEPPLTAYVAKSGAITIRRGDSESALASIQPGLFEAGWKSRSASFDRASGKPVIQAADAGAVVAIAAQPVQADGKTLRIEYVLTPDKDVKVNSVHVSLNLPAASLVGGKVSVGSNSATVPAAPGATHLVGSAIGPVSLANGPLQIRLDTGGTQPALVQDGRVFSGSDIEVRVGAQQERVWKAGQAERFTLTVELPDTVAVQTEAPITLQAGPDWAPLDLKIDVTPGSALDFSGILGDAPAGKHGRLIVRPDGHFGFEQRNAPQRFYGVNLCFSANYLSHEEADRLADRLARVGYNAVRIHHYEGELIDTSAPNSYTLRPDSLEKLDYLIAALKKRGIYSKTDLFVSRPVKPAEMGLSEGGMDDFKAAVLVSPPALENWKSFTRALLTHVNPYTKTAYKDEPALAWLSVVNEPNLTNMLSRMKGDLANLYTREWRGWLKEQYGSDSKLQTVWKESGTTLANAALPGSIDNSQRGRDIAAFATHMHRRGYARMKAFLRQEIGTKALLTDMNGWSETPAFMAARTDLDWVDNHFYWDHPRFLERDWSLPSEGGSGGRGAVETAGAGPSFLSMTRLFGKPFSVSEFNYSSPNRYRAEGGLIMGAASALQDWDAVWRFAYAHERQRINTAQPLNYFDVSSDPAGMAGERAALLLFLRGDLKPAPAAVSLVRSEKTLLQDRSEQPSGNFGELTLVARVGTRVESAAHPLPTASKNERRLTSGDPAQALQTLRSTGGLPAANRTNLEGNVRESATGEMLVDGKAGVLQIDTPRTAGGVAPAGTTLTAGPLTAQVAGTRAAVWTSSLDGRPIGQSKRLLLVHLTDVQNSGMRYSAPDRRVLEDWGTLPHLVRKGTAQVTLAHTNPSGVKVWRLDTSGKRVAPVAVRTEAGRAAFDLSSAAPDGSAVLYYEVEAR